MRDTVVVVPSLVRIPYRTEEKFVHASSLVHVGAGVGVQIAIELFQYDEVYQCLLIKITPPSVLRVLERSAVKHILHLADKVSDILILGRVIFLVVRILV